MLGGTAALHTFNSKAVREMSGQRQTLSTWAEGKVGFCLDFLNTQTKSLSCINRYFTHISEPL